MKRADVKSCASWVVTLPEELFENNSADQKKNSLKQRMIFECSLW